MGGLDRGVERQQIGLSRNRINHRCDLVDILDGGHQRRSMGHGAAGAARRFGDNPGCIADLGTDFADRGRQLFDRCGGSGGAGRGFVGDRGGRAGVAMRIRPAPRSCRARKLRVRWPNGPRRRQWREYRSRKRPRRHPAPRLFPPAARSRSAARADSASRSAMALSRNTATARAIAPISSLRRLPSMLAPESPSAIRLIVCAMRRSGRATKSWLKQQGAKKRRNRAAGEDAGCRPVNPDAAVRDFGLGVARLAAENIDQPVQMRGHVVPRRVKFEIDDPRRFRPVAAFQRGLSVRRRRCGQLELIENTSDIVDFGRIVGQHVFQRVLCRLVLVLDHAGRIPWRRPDPRRNRSCRWRRRTI